RARLHVHDDRKGGRQRPDGQDPSRADRTQPDALPLRRALRPHDGTVEVVRGADLRVHQQEERGEHAARRRVALRAPRVPFRSRGARNAGTARGIPVLRAPGRNADAVAELTVALLFAVNRGVVRADLDVREGEVYRDGTIPYQRFRAWQLAGRTAGLVGLGAVGRATRWRLEGLGMRVIAHDPYADDATHSLDDLLAEADVVSMHAMVTPETQGMIGAEQFARMKDDAMYVNTARAMLHDTDALVGALESGTLAGAGLDHFEGEHLPADHPLQSMPNVVLTPHIGGATYDTEANHSKLIADGLEQLLGGGKPDNLVNPEVLS